MTSSLEISSARRHGGRGTPSTTHESLIELRQHFLPEIVKTLEDF